MSAQKVRTFQSVNELIERMWPERPPAGHSHRAFYDTATTTLRELERLVCQAIGAPVLVVHRHESFQGCVGFGYTPRDEDYTVSKTCLLGIVRQPGLLLTRRDGDLFPRVEITVDRHVWAGDAMMNRSVHVATGNICGNAHASPVTGWEGLNIPLRARNPWNALNKPLCTEVIVGDEAVCAWAKKHHHELFLRDAFRQLGYAIASPAIDERVTTERVRHANALEPLWLKRRMLHNRIEALTSCILNGEHPIWEGEADARIATHKDREELANVERQLREHMSKLAEYGVGDATPNIHLIRHIAEQLGIQLTK
ncbi:MAG: hypothetical protein IT405_03295 [Candidatus Yanofskybacteria bacterium]|nr:hypothetical protein [Candidatus Yanofskybacteria bacterium]